MLVALAAVLGLLRVNASAADTSRPLPVVGCWNTGEFQRKDGEDAGYSPDWQFERIREGRPVRPTFEFHSHALFPDVRRNRRHYYEPLWSHARDERLPLVFVGRNFADTFRQLEPWKSLSDAHPFVEFADGTIQRRYTSPWSRQAGHWYELGRRFGEYLRREFAVDYPNPPSVLLLDNNEAGITPLNVALQDIAAPDRVKDCEPQLAFREMWDGYRLRRSLLIEGLQDGCPEWARVLRIYSYGEFGQSFMSVEQREHPGRFRYPWSDFGKLEFAGYHGVTANIGYLHSWSTHSPHKVRSPQVEACNARYAWERYRLAMSPTFDVETHFWNGQRVDADVWKGVVRCVLWTMRSESNRLFLGSTETVADTYERDMQPLMEAVQEVHDNPTLQRFWQHGTLLQNRWERDWADTPAVNPNDTQTGYGHPYWWLPPPEEYDSAKRWFLQRVPLNQRFAPWEEYGGPDGRYVDRWAIDRQHQVDVPVFAIALQLGDEYLVYAHAPQQPRDAVTIEVCPDGHTPRFTLTVDVPVEGQFWLRTGPRTRPLSADPRP